MLEILGVLIFSDSLPRLVLELTSSGLAVLASKLESISPAPAIDLVKLKELVAAHQPVSAAVATSSE